MSFRVSLTVHTGPDTTATVWGIGTDRRLVPILDHALHLPNGVRSLDGRHAGSAAALIIQAADRLKVSPAAHKLFTPPGGWGDYDIARDWMRKLGEACRTHPNACIDVE